MIAGSTATHMVCVCTQHQNAILLVDAINWDVTKDLWNLRRLNMMESFITQWQTTDRATLVTLTTTYNEYKETLMETINDLTCQSYLTKCQVKLLKTKKRKFDSR